MEVNVSATSGVGATIDTTGTSAAGVVMIEKVATGSGEKLSATTGSTVKDCATTELEVSVIAASWFESELTTSVLLSDRFRKKTSL